MKKLSKGFTLIRTKLHLNLVNVKGFTLIELLIVIAVIGVLAAAVWTALDPTDKIKSANDAKAQSDIGSIAQAEEAYATSKSGFYANTQSTDLTGNGDLKSALVPPTGYTYTITATTDAGGACVSGTTCTRVMVSTGLLSKKYSAIPFWVYCSYGTNAGKALARVDATCP